MLKIKKVNKIFNERSNPFQALYDIDLSIEKGELLSIVGKSGSGKSTLMHIMAGLDKPTSGEVVLKGENLNDMNKAELAKVRNRNFGFIFQQFFLLPRSNVLENVILPLKVEGMNSNERRERGMIALKEVGLEKKAKNKGTELSGGQKQRVAIARAIITNPNIIFADEPTGNLDSVTGKKVEDLLFKLNEDRNITLVVVTHDKDLSSKCEREIVLKDGKIISDKNLQ